MFYDAQSVRLLFILLCFSANIRGQEQAPELKVSFSTDKILAATMPQPYPTKLTNGDLQLDEDVATITILNRGKTVLVYNKQSPPVPEGMNPLYHRSGFLHPVSSPLGETVTATFPADHAHQHGIFSAWVKTSWNDRSIDFWNLAGGTGRVLHERVVSTAAIGDRLSFEVDLIHRAEQSPVVDILRERWKITAIPTDGTYHAFDLETTQQAQTDIPLILQEYHYGGMAVRGPIQWLSADKTTKSDVARETCSIVNDLGSDRIKGNHEHAKWVCMTGVVHDRPVTIAVLGHRTNFRAPQAARLHPTKPYFVFSPCVDGEFAIDRQHSYQANYRYLVLDAAPDPEWLNKRWNEWAE